MPRPRRLSFFRPGRASATEGLNWRLWVAIGALLGFVVLGGGPLNPGFGANLMLALGGACLLAFAAQGSLRRLFDLPLIEIFCWIAIVAVPLLQLVPLPPSFWSALPGHDVETEILALAGQSGAWRPLTLDFGATLATFAMTLALGGVFLSGLSLPEKAISKLLIALAAVIALSILVGALQLSSSGRMMNFYVTSHRGLLLGFFANRNHQALLIAIGILVVGYLIGKSHLPKRQHLALFGLCAFVLFSAAFGTASRTGLAMCLVASFAAPFLFLDASIRRRNAIIGGGLLVGVLAGLTSISGTAGRALERYGDVGADYRWTIWERSVVPLGDYFPFGSGLGTFADVYQKYEQVDWLLPNYVNDAHNDYLQLVIETGLPGIVALLLLLAVLARAIWMTHSPDRHGNTGPTSLTKLGTSIIFLILAHSFVDYPLRRPATAAIFVLALALVFRQRLKRIETDRKVIDSARA